MKTFTSLLTIIMLISTGALGQSIFLESMRNSFFAKSTLTTSNNYKEGELTIGYIVNSSINVNISYDRAASLFEPTKKDLSGIGMGGSISAMLLNEFKNDPLGIELGFSFDHTKYTFKEYNNSIENNSLGVHLSFSKIISRETSIPKLTSLYLFTFGVNSFPYSESKLTRKEFFSNEYRYSDQFNSQHAKVFISPSFIVGGISQRVFLTPVVDYNFVDNIWYFKFSVLTVF